VSARLQIDCVTKDARLNPYAQIRRIGGPNLPGVAPPDGSRVVAALRRRGLPVLERPRWAAVGRCVEGVLNGTWSFFIELGADLVDVETPHHRRASSISSGGGSVLRTSCCSWPMSLGR
jgi:hypothetical protein